MFTSGASTVIPLIAETGAWRDGFCPASALPMPLPAIPSIEQVGESIIVDARNLMDHGKAKHPAEPDIAWGSKPNGDRAIRAYVQAARRAGNRQVVAVRRWGGG